MSDNTTVTVFILIMNKIRSREQENSKHRYEILTKYILLNIFIFYTNYSFCVLIFLFYIV